MLRSELGRLLSITRNIGWWWIPHTEIAPNLDKYKIIDVCHHQKNWHVVNNSGIIGQVITGNDKLGVNLVDCSYDFLCLFIVWLGLKKKNYYNI